MSNEIKWGETRVKAVHTAYCSRAETIVSGGKFGHRYTLPAEYAVKDQSGLIRKRFEVESEAIAYAASLNS